MNSFGAASPNIDAMASGMQAGTTAAQGMLPSAQQPLGSQQAIDPLADQMSELVADAVSLASQCQRTGDDKRMHGFLKVAAEVQGFITARKAELARTITK